jgi:predicted nucleotidyltransferase
MRNCGLEENELQIINSVFACHPNISSVKIFGSRAKGNFRSNSDVDLALFGKIDYLEAEEIKMKLDELDLPYLFDVKIFDKITNKDLRNHINRVGIFLYLKP